MKELVGNQEQREIDKLVDRILKDLGNPEPPLSLPQVRQLLALDLTYYSSTDVGPLTEFAHRIRVAGKQLAARPSLLLDVVKKAKLSGLWMPDNRQIFIDQEVPKPKHRWIEAHEITHSFIPWHADFLLGDDEMTLDPTCHETIEAEANFGAGKLLFLGNQFSREARDYNPSFKSISALKNRFGNTLTSTFWRFVEDRDPGAAVFGLISIHPRHPHVGARVDGSPIHHFVTSGGFRTRFPAIGPLDVYELVRRNCTWNSKGPVVGGHDVLLDGAGTPVRFVLDGFSNTYQVLTYGIAL
ncbi:ImmA/IrrE family metallo-endopeptidase [Arenimonas malthae]|uniref:ImmA/IrrE family metallo-endopeptidase n=1 Tax=Arenimonas malthae TaxID=354197 RepID=UPI000A069B9A|nr:hypothetical protein [Arenimonas malthae]